jgi:ubiquinone/menaquinone biosynthesis C-methylase UbiE
MATHAGVDQRASSTGQAHTAAAWLDVHFEANRGEYEAQVRAAGIQPGWHVLDAGCGGGNFLPWLADLVGPTGRLAALDLAPDNIAIVEGRRAAWEFATPVETRVGSVLTLPYPDATFDAVWCANTTQYLSDVELDSALAEFRRVVRPGGLVAIKENDPTLNRLFPAPTGLIWHWFEARARTTNHWSLRAPALPSWLRRAGLTGVTRRTTLIERTTPLASTVLQLFQEWFVYCVGVAPTLDLPAADHAFWESLKAPAAVDQLLKNPDFYSSQGNILVIGQVPHDRSP